MVVVLAVMVVFMLALFGHSVSAEKCMTPEKFTGVENQGSLDNRGVDPAATTLRENCESLAALSGALLRIGMGLTRHSKRTCARSVKKDVST